MAAVRDSTRGERLTICADVRHPSSPANKSLRGSRGPEAGVRGIPSPFIKIYVRGRYTPPPSLLPLVLMRRNFLDELLDAAPAIDRNDLPGNVGCVPRQKQSGARNVLWGAVALEGGLVDDFPLQLVLHVALRPQHWSRCNAVDADFRSQLARQRPGQHRQARLGRAVHRMCLEGA